MKKRLMQGIALLLLSVTPALAQQAGTINGKVTTADGEGLPGVAIAATSSVLPQARQVVSGADGGYQMPLLPPGTYEVSFALEGMATVRKSVQVALQQTATVDASLSIDAVSEEIVVVGTSSLVNTSSAELNASVTQETIEALPVGQEYRDLVKLIPGVQYTEDNVRGPSAGGSGQDNTYLFDGVNVTLPLFGTLSAEPSSHDIDQIAVVKGGANAVDFNRAAGFLMNSISRSGTNAFRASLTYQAQPESLTADRDNAGTVFEEDKEWWIGNVGGPILRDRLYFYASYFAPNSTRENRSNLYGEVPDFESDRDELFGKLTFAPTDSLLFHASYRTSERTDTGTSVSTAASAGSTSNGSEATLDIGIFEASWVIDEKSYASFRFTDFENQTTGRPDNLFAFEPRLDGSVDLNIASLDTQGFIVVPGSSGANAFQQGYINQYGYLVNGTPVGGGRVGGGAQLDNNDFYRQSYQGSYDRIFGEDVTHAFHIGYQWTRDEEDLLRSSNGWGTVTIPGGTTFCPANSSCAGQRIYFQAGVLQQGITLPNGVQVPVIHSEYESQNLELNDTIRWDDFTFNVGLLVSNDKLYGQGLKPNSTNVSGFEVARGHKYEMYEIDFADTLQPRLGAVWAYDQSNTVFANYARYVPAASSLPRAASWARNSAGQVNAYFDQDGNFIGSSPEAGSSGKFFADDLDPRTTDEYMIGTTRELGGGWSARAHARYRYSFNFWEDTENDSRLRYDPPPGIPRELYIREPRGGARGDRRLELRHRRARQLVHQVLGGGNRDRVARCARLRQRLLRLESLLRQHGPGQQRGNQPGERQQHLHRLVEHRRRRRTPALGLQVRRPARRPPAQAEDVRLLHPALEGERRRLRDLSVGAAVGGAQLPLLSGLDPRHQHQRHQPLRRARRLEHDRSAPPARPRTTPRNFRSASASTCRRASTSSTSTTSRRATTSRITSTARTSASRRRSTIRAGSSSRCVSSSSSVLKQPVPRPAAPSRAPRAFSLTGTFR